MHLHLLRNFRTHAYYRSVTLETNEEVRVFQERMKAGFLGRSMLMAAWQTAAPVIEVCFAIVKGVDDKGESGFANVVVCRKSPIGGRHSWLWS